MKGFNYKKAVQALNYFAVESGGTLNKMKALKLIWLADRYHLRHYGRTITGDVYFALPHGPVASTTRDIMEKNVGLSDDELNYSEQFLKSTGGYDFGSNSDPNQKVFSKTDIDVLKIIFETYNKFNHFQLSDISHNFPEWRKYEASFKSGNQSRFEIKKEEFFENHQDGQGLFEDDEEFLNVAKEISKH